MAGTRSAVCRSCYLKSQCSVTTRTVDRVVTAWVRDEFGVWGRTVSGGVVFTEYVSQEDGHGGETEG